MTIAKDFAAKASVAFVAAAMLFSMIAPAAQAQSAEDLQKMINDLMGQISALQGQGGTSSSVASGICPYTWTRDLKTGSTGADVMKLQQFLNANADTRVSASGVGSVGMETEYFGPATAAAVSKFQVMHRAEVLTPAGLVNPTGFFGPGTRAKANSLCVATTPTTPTTPSTGGDDEDEDSSELSGEASLDTFELDTEESSVEEGESDVVVAKMSIEFEDGDASISRLDVTLDGSETNAVPWDLLDTISLWVDGDMVAEMDASDEDEYLDEDAGEIRFSGLDIVAMEGEELEVSVAVSVQNNLDTEELDSNWTLEVSSMRYFDADGVASTDSDPAGSDSAEFDVDVAGADEEIKLSLSSSNPDATDIVVDTDSDTNDVTVMVADIEAEDNDIELNRVVVRIDTVATTTTNVVDDVRVEIDGQSFDAESFGTLAAGESQASSTGNFAWYLFDIDGDIVIDEDSEVSMEVIVDLNDTDDAARYPNGTTVKASVTSVERDLWQAEGAEDLGTGQFSGTAVGDTHTLVAEGILVPVDGFTSETDTQGQDDTTGVFTLEFEVTAVEGDFYVTDNATTSTAVTDGVVYSVTGGTAATLTQSLTSTADEDTTGVFTVREGETETFTLVVNATVAAPATLRVQLDEIWYTSNTNGTSATAAYLPTPVTDYRTSPQSIN
jgi:hypothetical protein